MKGKLAFALALVAVLVVGAPAASPSVEAQDVQLACSDGTNLALALDLSAVAQLTDAVSAMTLYPAGDPALSCGVSQSSSSSVTSPSPSSSSSGGRKDFAVGGGQLVYTCGIFVSHTSFALSAHVPTGTPATAPQPGVGGTFNLSFPQCSAATQCGLEPGHLVSKVDCVEVDPISPPGTARITSHVTKASGVFATFGPELSISVSDTGTNMGDTLAIGGTDQPCNFTIAPADVVDRGNINIRSGA
jgi:hypothetical protein